SESLFAHISVELKLNQNVHEVAECSLANNAGTEEKEENQNLYQNFENDHVLVVFMTMFHGCSTYSIDSTVCLNRPLMLAMGKKACGCTLEYARKRLESDEGNCVQKCHVKMNYLYEQYNYHLIYTNLTFNGLSVHMATSCNYNYGSYGRRLEIVCNSDGESYLSKDLRTSMKECNDVFKTCLRSYGEQIGMCACKPGYIGFETECLQVHLKKHLCTSTEGCQDVSKSCSLTGQVGVCVCKHGYIGFGNKCLKGSLRLNETCQRHEQCSEPSGSVCQNDTCVLSFDDKPQSSIRDPKVNNLDGMTFGILFGGLVRILCIILTAVAVTIYHNARQKKTNTEEEESPAMTLFNNTIYEANTCTDVVYNYPPTHLTSEITESNEPLFANLSFEIPVNGNVQRASKRLIANNDVNEVAIRHRHEEEDNRDLYQNTDNIYGIVNL
ncbi:uncharacterized protein LOC134240624, partial [Saccostrea cucullata]|uniref:uncharacterized protein LOC134240624 n=1 Tax=Saccostrea cuccullata TaxID=36930 RepID=UPI002ED535E5